MNGLLDFLETSYTAYQATEHAAAFLKERGFTPLSEHEEWKVRAGGKYYVVRGGSSIIAFTLGAGENYKIIASHTDSPCLKLKENPIRESDGFCKLNAEPYGGGIWYSFFDRPLALAGRTVTEKDGKITAKNFVSDFRVLIPSLAIHMNRGVNESFAPDLQTDLQPVLSLKKTDLDALLGSPVSCDIYAVCAEKPFVSGADGELISAPRVDNLTSVYASLRALAEADGNGICVCACLDSEEVGSRTQQGAGSDFLRTVLARIALCLKLSEEAHCRALAASFLISLDNAHSVHPNRPEKCDPTNRARLGGGVVIKGHADKAYTTDAVTSAVLKTVFQKAGVKYQCFYNRSDMRSGGTLGAISLGQVSVPSADLGIAQLAMHSAVETFAKDDFLQVEKGLKAFYATQISVTDCGAQIK